MREKGTQPMKKTLSQSGLPVQRKFQKTTSAFWPFLRNCPTGSFFGIFFQLVNLIGRKFFPLAECPSRASFDRSHDRFATIWNSGPIWALLGPKRGIFLAKTGPFGVPGDPEKAQYPAKVCGNHDSNPVRPIGGGWDQIWPPGALQDPRGPPKGPFGAKTGPFGGPGVQ